MGAGRDLVFEILAIDGASHVFEKIGVKAEEAGAKVEGSSSHFGKLGKVGTMALAGMAAGVVMLGAKTIHMAADFNQGLTTLVTSAGESQKNLGLVGNGIKNIAIATGTSTQQLTSGMYMIESAGFHGAIGLNVLKAAAQGARAENASLGTVSNALTTAMKDMPQGMGTATQAMNALIATTSQGKMRMEDLAGALHSVLPVAAAAHLSYAQVGGAIATMTSHGVSAENATQHLAFLIRSLQAPSNVAAQEMGRMGLSAIDVSQHLGTRGLTGTMNMLVAAITQHMGPSGLVLMNAFNSSRDAAASAKGMLDAMPPSLRALAVQFQAGQISVKDWHKEVKTLPVEQANMAAQFASATNRSRGFNDALKNNRGASETFTSALKKVTGGAVGLETALQLTGQNAGQFSGSVANIAAASHHAGANVENWGLIQHQFNFKLSQFHQVLQVAGITIGQKLLPAAGAMVGLFIKGAGAVGPMVGWLGKHKEVAIGLGVAIGAALVPAMWGMVTAAWGAVSAFVAANIATGGIILAIGLAVAGVIYAYEHFSWFRHGVQAAFEGVKDAALFMWHNALEPIFGAVKWYISNILVPEFQILYTIGKFVFEGIAAYVGFMWNNFVGPAFHAIGAVIGGVVIPYFKLLYTVSKTIFTGIGAFIGFWVAVAVALFKFLWTKIWDTFGQPLWNLFMATVPNLLQTGWRLLNQYFINPWRQAFTQLYQWIWSDFGQKVYNFFAQTLPGWFRTGVQNVKSAFGSFANAVLIPVNWVITNVWDGGIERIWNDAAGVFAGPKLSPVGTISLPGFAAGGVVPGTYRRPTAIVGEGNPAYPEYVIPTDPRHRGRAQGLWAAAGNDMQMLAGGGILGDIWGGITGIAGDLKNLALGGLQAAAKAAFGTVNDLLGHVPGGAGDMGQLLTSAVKTGEAGILKLLGAKDATAVKSGPATSAQVLAWITAAMADDGVSGPAWINGLETIIKFESGGNPRAINLTDSNAAAGDPSRGLMQTIGSTFNAYHQPGTSFDIYDPIANICAGINYINAVYGGIANVPGIRAVANGGSYVGYWNGGTIPVGSVGLVGEHGPELVAGGRAGVSVSPIRGGDGAFHAVLDLRLNGRHIDQVLVEFQRTGGQLESAQTEIRRTQTVAGTLSR